MRPGLSLALAVLLLGSAAAAAPSAKLTPFEQQTLEECAARLGVSPAVDTEAEGKRIERIDIVVLDVFDEHDPVPDFVNVFHTMSRKSVIERELLFRAGQRYVGARVDESARTCARSSSSCRSCSCCPWREASPIACACSSSCGTFGACA